MCGPEDLEKPGSLNRQTTGYNSSTNLGTTSTSIRLSNNFCLVFLEQFQLEDHDRQDIRHIDQKQRTYHCGFGQENDVKIQVRG